MKNRDFIVPIIDGLVGLGVLAFGAVLLGKGLKMLHPALPLIFFGVFTMAWGWNYLQREREKLEKMKRKWKDGREEE